MTQTAKRYETLDAVRGLAILIVMLGHCIVLNGLDDPYFYDAIIAIQMPLFMMVSGVVSGSRSGDFVIDGKISMGKWFLLLKKRTISYLVPFFTWLVLTHITDPVAELKLQLFALDRGLWFLMTLWVITVVSMVAELVAHAIRTKHVIKLYLNGSVCLLFYVLFFLQGRMGNQFLSPSLTVKYMPFYIIGYILMQLFLVIKETEKFQREFLEQPEKWKRFGMICFIVSILIFCFFMAMFDMKLATFSGMLIEMVASLFGCFVCFYGVHRFVKGKGVKFLSFLGIYTLPIYALHFRFARLLGIGHKALQPFSPEAILWILAAFVLMSILTAVSIYVMKKFWIVDFLCFGKGNLKKEQKITLLVLLLFYVYTLVTGNKIFSADPLNMNSLPIDESAVGLMQLVSRVGAFFVVYGMLRFLSYAKEHKVVGLAGLIYFVLFVALLLCNYPGYTMSDDAIIFGYATRFYPVYWHHYLTSVYYCIGMTLFPASCGPVLLNDLCLALVLAYVTGKTWECFEGKKRYAILVLPILPFVLLSALLSFRPALYTPLFLFFFAKLYFDHLQKKTLTVNTMLLLAFISAILCTWRSEGIILLPFVLLLLPLCYKARLKQVLLFVLCFVLMFSVIKYPQSKGEEEYYGKDYLILATVRPLSLIVHREQTYDGAEEDLKNIGVVIDMGYLNYETLSCTSYHRYNSDHNAGKYTETGADLETQQKFIKSAFRLILHNLDLYAAERWQAFLVANGIYDYDDSFVMHLKMVTTDSYHLHDSDAAYGKELIEGNKRLPLSSNDGLALFLFRFGGEAYIPVLILLILACAYALIREKWMEFLMLLSLLAREGIIFMSAPAAFIQYNYPTMFVTCFLVCVMVVEGLQTKKDLK